MLLLAVAYLGRVRYFFTMVYNDDAASDVSRYYDEYKYSTVQIAFGAIWHMTLSYLEW